MRDQDPQPSQPFGARKPRPEELEQQRRAAEPKPLRSTNLPTPAPQHINDHEMIRKDLGARDAMLKPHIEAFMQFIEQTIVAKQRAAIEIKLGAKACAFIGTNATVSINGSAPQPVRVSTIDPIEDTEWKSGPPPAEGWYIASNSQLEHYARYWWVKEWLWSTSVRLDRPEPYQRKLDRKATRMGPSSSAGVKWLRAISGGDLP